jgi:ATP:ADP antiporter, AAA family
MAKESSCIALGKWRSLLWPIYGHELKKLVPMLVVFLLITFNYNVLRCMKDSLVITAKNSGAEVIPFIKSWVMFPMSLLLTWVFIRLSNRFSREHVFYIMMGSFLVFFAFFGFIFYPRSEHFHLQSFANYLTGVLPEGLKGFINMIRYWSFTLFYTMCELWSNIILSLLCWGFANQITKLDEAKRFYGILGVAINISGIFAGQLSTLVTKQATCWFPIDFHGDPWGPTLLNLLVMVVGVGTLALGALWYLNKVLREHQELCPVEDSVAANKERKKKRFSLRENMSFLLSSKYVLYIAVMIIGYNIVINLTEILWKQEVKELYPNPIQFNLYMNEVTTWISIVATFSSLLIAGNSLRIFGWTKTALITPTILLITSVGFFGFFFLKGSPHLPYILAGLTPLQLVVFFGTFQNCCSRAAKYAVFDATKEMAFIPLSQEEKIKGKAAIDGVCNRLGKSGGSIIYQFLLITFSSISACAPYVAIILFSIIALWMVAIRNLGRQFNEKTMVPASVPA